MDHRRRLFCALKKAMAMTALSAMAAMPMTENGAAKEAVMGGAKLGAVKTGVGDPKMGTGGGRGLKSLSFFSFFFGFFFFFFGFLGFLRGRKFKFNEIP